jgi:enoyl-CoA hydratase/carnithine racemase
MEIIQLKFIVSMIIILLNLPPKANALDYDSMDALKKGN